MIPFLLIYAQTIARIENCSLVFCLHVHAYLLYLPSTIIKVNQNQPCII